MSGFEGGWSNANGYNPTDYNNPAHLGNHALGASHAVPPYPGCSNSPAPYMYQYYNQQYTHQQYSNQPRGYHPSTQVDSQYPQQPSQLTQFHQPGVNQDQQNYAWPGTYGAEATKPVNLRSKHLEATEPVNLRSENLEATKPVNVRSEDLERHTSSPKRLRMSESSPVRPNNLKKKQPEDTLNFSLNNCEKTDILSDEDIADYYKNHLNNEVYQILMQTHQGKCVLSRHIVKSKEIENIESENEFIESSSEEEDDEEAMSESELMDYDLGNFNHGRSDIHLKKYILCNAVLDHELAICSKIEGPRFEELSTCIGQLFNEPKEKYYKYVPKAESHTSYGGSFGYLYQRYRRLRRLGIACKLVKKRGISSAQKATNQDKLTNEIQSWNKDFVSIDSDYKKKWSNNIVSRQSFFKISSLKTIYDVCKSLKEDEGYSLLIDDFDEQNAALKDQFLKNWPAKATELIKASQTSAKSKNIPDDLKVKKTEVLDQDYTQVKALTLLPYLLGSNALGSAGSKNKPKWTPSATQLADSFIIVAESINDLRTRQKNIDIECARMNQPLDFSLAVLEPLKSINLVYMKIGESQYELHQKTLIEAIDILFKCITSLRHPLPAINKHVWVYLKTNVYMISSDTTFQSITRLNEHIKNMHLAKTPKVPKKTKTKRKSEKKVS